MNQSNRLNPLDRLLASPLLLLIRGYQLSLSLIIGRQCRFEPSCSHYMADAIREHGVVKGIALGSKRLSRCHPWHEGGFDPVPSKQTNASNTGKISDTTQGSNP